MAYARAEVTRPSQALCSLQALRKFQEDPTFSGDRATFIFPCLEVFVLTISTDTDNPVIGDCGDHPRRTVLVEFTIISARSIAESEKNNKIIDFQ